MISCHAYCAGVMSFLGTLAIDYLFFLFIYLSMQRGDFRRLMIHKGGYLKECLNKLSINRDDYSNYSF